MVGIAILIVMFAVAIGIGVCFSLAVAMLAGSAWGFVFLGAFLILVLAALTAIALEISKLEGGAE